MANNDTNEEITISISNEIGDWGKFFACVLLVLFTVLPILLLIAFWPDRLPSKEANTMYFFKWFHVRLISNALRGNDLSTTNGDTANKETKTALFVNDTLNLTKKIPATVR